MINQKKIIKELITKDSKLEKIFDTPKQCPFFAEPLMKEEVLFFELAQSIVGQQISAKAAEAIWKRIIFSSKNKKEFLNFISSIFIWLKLLKFNFYKIVCKRVQQLFS